MQFKEITLSALADLICGNATPPQSSFFVYRSSSALTRFFRACDVDAVHDGSTRHLWVTGELKKILSEPHPNAFTPPDAFSNLICELMEPADAQNEGPERPQALALLNKALGREGFEAFYAEDRKCHLRHIGSKTVVSVKVDPHRPLSAAEVKKRADLVTYLDSASEDELISDVLLPLFRQLGFTRITSAGHKDKALEFGKDVWMKFTLPTRNVLYFGIQAKKSKIDSSGVTKNGNINISEIYNQALMMLGHMVFDSETQKKALVDHAFIISGGEITKTNSKGRTLMFAPR